jgi:hypothetical protein
MNRLPSKEWHDGARASKREAENSRLQQKNRRSLETRKKNRTGTTKETRELQSSNHTSKVAD